MYEKSRELGLLEWRISFKKDRSLSALSRYFGGEVTSQLRLIQARKETGE